MKVLSVNAGSSSLKFKLYEMPEGKDLISGNFERIGIDNSFYTIKINGEKTKKELSLPNHKVAFTSLVEELINNNIVESLEEIKGIGHRIVQGGDYFDKTVVIDEKVIAKIEEFASLAPLHNPAAIIGIRAAQEVIPNATQTAVFDTAFHQTMKVEQFLYGLPYDWYTKYKARRYGAHGTSHKYVSERINEILGRQDIKTIICHIGNGASISAVENGKCINTSMGLTPNAGLIMGTRCGDIDATIIPYIMDKTGLSIEEVTNIMNKESGLLGISGISSDSRDIEEGIKDGNERCVLAQKMYVRRIIDYIAKYYFEMNGVDAIVFTAGVGENSLLTRAQVIEGLEVMGIKLNGEANNSRGREVKITSEDSKIPCYVIPTDEEIMIAKDTFELI
ncbi:MAG: acetate kinase [Bacilli bacterium]|nr:acetate kinase [Bacilli bacterium]MDD4733869.1 acetate kinase [Bacilli bacterium]